MLQVQADAYANLLGAYVSGALAPDAALVVQAHARLRPEAMARLELAESLAGTLLDQETPAPMAGPSADLPAPLARARKTHDVWSLIDAAASDPDQIPWRWRPFGLREAPVGVAGASLVRLRPGAAMPLHDHEDQELTLVLFGAFEDERSIYAAGELVIAERGMAHRPLVHGPDECVCLISKGAGLRLKAVWSEALRRLLG